MPSPKFGDAMAILADEGGDERALAIVWAEVRKLQREIDEIRVERDMAVNANRPLVSALAAMPTDTGRVHGPGNRTGARREGWQGN